jgi:radical SAM superfamily enzyme YgiQ (UPF0313 family)
MMREAYFCTIFCGIETPDPVALKAMHKDQNNQMPVLEAIGIIHSFGMEVVSGIIMGLDSDTPDTAEKILEFVEVSHIPLLTINLLQALPRTPLWRRLESEGRLVIDVPGRESNVDFKLPYDQMVDMWRRTFTAAYRPEALYRRFKYHVDHVFPNRITPPNSKQRVNLTNIRLALRILGNLLVRVGLLSDYRTVFWKMAKETLAKGNVEALFHIGMVSHHLITYAREAAAGAHGASFYNQETRDVVPEPRVLERSA